MNQKIILLNANKGSDIFFKITHKDDQGNNRDMTGYALKTFDDDTSPELAGNVIEYNWTDQSQGQATGEIQWPQHGLPMGASIYFRIETVKGDKNITTPRIWIDIT